MLNLFRAELLKQSRTSFFKVLLLAPPILTAALIGIFLFVQALAGQDLGQPPGSVLAGIGPDFGGGVYYLSATIFLQGIAGLYSLGLVIVGGQIINTEFSLSTIKMLATREPSRAKILATKILYLAFMALVIALIMLACWLAYSGVLKFAYKQPLGLAEQDWDAIGKGLKYTFLTFGFYFIWGLMGIMLAMRFKSVVASVIFYFIYSAIDGAAANIGTAALNGQFGNEIPAWLKPLVDFSKLIAPFLLNTNYGRLAYQATDERYVEAISAYQAGLVLVVWAIIFSALAYLVFRNRDITD